MTDWSPAALEYFERHAINPEVAAQLRVDEVDGHLTYPYDGFIRKRSLANGKTYQPKGTPLAPWAPLGNDGVVLACEGESDLLAAASLLYEVDPADADFPYRRDDLPPPLTNIVPIALPGAGSAHEAIADLLDAFGVNAYIVLDADVAGRKAAEKLKAVIDAKGPATPAAVVELPDGMDLADFIAAADDPVEGLANALVNADGAADELRDNGADEARGATDDGTVLPPPNAPMQVARVLAGERYSHPSGVPVLRHWRGGWWRWQGSHWVEIEHRAARADAYAFTEHAVYIDAKGNPKPWVPNRHKVADLLEAFAAVCHLPEGVAQPSWIDGGHDGVIVACANGLLDVGRRELLDHDPHFFNQTAVPFAYEPDAGPPRRWLGFLNELWPGDSDSIAALQEWLGYVVSGRLDLHKILLLVGPTRGGKGAIARVLGALVGRENVAGPTLSSLAGDFGLAPLLGKPLAVISDARMAGRGSQVVVERLLAISGEDTITVNRKYRDQWTGKLPSRFMVISNELPQLGDASAAITGRFVALLLTHSWLGKEDHTLEPELHAELPGILNWALDGLERLAERNAFTRPASTDEAITALRDLASPVAAFVRDRCVIGQHEVAVDELWNEWKSWAEDNGHPRATKQVFGRNLRAAVPRIQVTRPRDDDEARHRVYLGIALKGVTKA